MPGRLRTAILAQGPFARGPFDANAYENGHHAKWIVWQWL
jgi:hypothetical protein